jgi:hypothetical protein
MGCQQHTKQLTVILAEKLLYSGTRVARYLYVMESLLVISTRGLDTSTDAIIKSVNSSKNCSSKWRNFIQFFEKKLVCFPPPKPLGLSHTLNQIHTKLKGRGFVF